MQISSASTEYIKVQVSAIVGGQPHNPTSDPCFMAFIPPAQSAPTTGDWHSAIWETVNGSQYNALCLIGPNGGVALTAGTYTVWVKIQDNPESPVKMAGSISIT